MPPRAPAVLAAALLADDYADEAVTAYEKAAAALESYGAGRQAALVWRELAAVLKTMGRESDTIVALERVAMMRPCQYCVTGLSRCCERD
ncbi:MAG: hypothetical protein ACJ74O_14575 [Frankiaceae bacterium]